MTAIGRARTTANKSLTCGRAGAAASRHVAGMVMAVALGALAVTGCDVRPAESAADQWVPAGNTNMTRSRTKGILLRDGSVLLTGGRSEMHLGSLTDRFYPVTGEWHATGNMQVARKGHRSVLLADGRVLVSGGLNDEVIASLPGGGNSTGRSLLRWADLVSPATAELYDPDSGTFSATGAMVGGVRWGHAAVVLPDGRVLVAGGSDGVAPLASAELYDPATGTWRRTADMATRRYEPISASLPDGRVLVAGGTAVKTNYVNLMRGQTSVEAYDPATERWTPLSPMHEPRFWNAATMLADGRLLVAGPVVLTDDPRDTYGNSEIYDPATGRWEQLAPMLHTADYRSDAAQLPSGRVLYVNAVYQLNLPTEAQVFDLQLGRWADVVQPERGRGSVSLTTLRDGRCLMTGGRREAEIFVEAGWQPTETPTVEPSGTPTPTAEPTRTVTATASPSPTVTPPPYGSWSRTGHMLYPRAVHAAVLLRDGRVLVAGGYDGWEEYPRRAEVFDPATNLWADAGDTTYARKWPTGLLLDDGRVLLIGGYDPTRGSHRSPFWPPPEVFDPRENSWSVLETDVVGNYGSSHQLLPDGRVLLSGFTDGPFTGYYGTAGRSDTMLLDVESGAIEPGPDMGVKRTLHWTAVLETGTVLLGGGTETYEIWGDWFATYAGGTPKTIVQAYDPYNNGLRQLSPMPREPWRDLSLIPKGNLNHQTVLPDGRVMVTNGVSGKGPLIYDPGRDMWAGTAPSSVARQKPVVALLTNGLVLFVSGGGDRDHYDFTAELYDPEADTWFWAAGVQNNFSALHDSATTLLDGRVLLVKPIGLGSDDRAMLYTYGLPRVGRVFAPAVYSR